jgi:small subunit ribosomal protein S17
MEQHNVNLLSSNAGKEPSADVYGGVHEARSDAVQRSMRGDSVIERARRRVKQGRVVSNKMAKTIVVVCETRVPHPVYKKIVRKSVRFKAHDERNEASIGDVVRIAECRPLSKEKRWRLLEVVEKAQ